MAASVGRRSAEKRKLARGILWIIILALAFLLRLAATQEPASGAKISGLLFDVGTVAVAGVLGQYLGGARAGLLALLLTALCPSLVSRAGDSVAQSAAIFFVITCLALTHRLQTRVISEERSKAWLVAAIAGVSAGLAFVSLPLAGVVFVATLLRIVLTRTEAITKVQLLGIGGAGLLIAGFVGRQIFSARVAAARDSLREGSWQDALSFSELGIPLLLVAFLGLALLFQRSRATRITAISWIAFAVAVGVAGGRVDARGFSQVVPLVPAVCVAAAFLLARGDLWFKKPSTRKMVNDWIEPALALVVLLSLAVPTWRVIERQRDTADRDVRLAPRQ